MVPSATDETPVTLTHTHARAPANTHGRHFGGDGGVYHLDKKGNCQPLSWAANQEKYITFHLNSNLLNHTEFSLFIKNGGGGQAVFAAWQAQQYIEEAGGWGLSPVFPRSHSSSECQSNKITTCPKCQRNGKVAY